MRESGTKKGYTQFASEGFREQLKMAMMWVWRSGHVLHLLLGSSAQKTKFYTTPFLLCLLSVWLPRKSYILVIYNSRKISINMFLELSRYLNIGNDREEENDRESEGEATRIHLLLFFFFQRMFVCFGLPCSVKVFSLHQVKRLKTP